MSFKALFPLGSATRPIALAGLGLAGALLLAACGGTPTSGGQASPSPTASKSAAASSAPATGVTINTATVSDFGTVLVNAQGRTLYTLTSESAGKLTCTTANGCTQVWTEVDLPSGVSAATAEGSAQSSLLGTETGANGTLVTYNGWPLYTFTGDSQAGQAKGEGLQSFGGTWYVLNASGSTVHSGTATASPSSSGTYSY
jgi:predicted lipoprotein with Yx(FWY)xxD motif